MTSDYRFVINKKAVIGAVLVFAVFLAATWVFPTVAMITLPMIMLAVPEDEEYGKCTIIKSNDAYTERELIRSYEHVCERICMGAQADDAAHADNAGDRDILCQFESESTLWEKPAP